jgi:hypothetical protein
MALEQALAVPAEEAVEASGSMGETRAASTPVAQLDQQIARAYDWLAERQVDDLKGDWIENVQPDVPPGGWAFQYENPYYPDIDDSAVVAAMLHRRGRAEARRTGRDPYAARVSLALDWMRGLQSRNGGLAAFDADCDRLYLNAIPFADHGALLDPPTEDVSGRVLLCFGVTGREEERARSRAASTTSRRRSARTAAGGAAGAPTISTERGACWRDSRSPAKIRASRYARAACLAQGAPARGRRLGRNQRQLYRRETRGHQWRRERVEFHGVGVARATGIRRLRIGVGAARDCVSALGAGQRRFLVASLA